MTTFREPTNEMPYWLNISVDRARLWVNRRDGVGQIREQSFFLKDAEALLEVLLDICPNAYALAHNFCLEYEMAEYKKGGKP